MNGKLKATDTAKLEPTWTHPTIPGQAVQGSILFTTTDFVEPPQSSNVMKWMPMEDIIGIGDIKLEFNEVTSKFTLSKTRQHLDSEGQYEYDWEVVGEWVSFSEEFIEALQKMEHLNYTFSFQANNLVITGIKKDGTVDTLLNINIPTQEEFDIEKEERQDADSKLTDDLSAETNNRIVGDDTLTENLNNEIAKRESEDSNIKADMQQKVEYAIQYALNVVSQLNQEIGERKASDTVLQNNITAETVARTNSITNINQTMQSNYNALNSKIDAISGSAVHTEVVTEKPTNPTNNTMYYVGSEGNYEVWLYSNNQWYDMGSTKIDLAPYQTKAQAKIEHDELESKITTSSGDITTLNTNVSTLQTKTNSMSEDINTNKTNIDTNSANIATNKNNIATNTTNIATNKANIATNTSSINTLKTTVTKQKPLAGDQISVSEGTSGTTIALKGTSETWTFTLSDGSTVERTVRYF